METLIAFLIGLLVFVIIAGVVLWLVRYAVSHSPLSPGAQNAALAVTALILLIIFLLFVQRQGWIAL